MIRLPLRSVIVALAVLACADAETMRGQDLAPTAHPALPTDPSQYWLVPASTAPRTPTARIEVPGYSEYARALDLQAQGRLEQADALLTGLHERGGAGYLPHAVTVALADVALARGNAERAHQLLDDLSDEKLLDAADVFLRLATAAEQAGDVAAALAAYRTVYYDHPLTMQAADAQAGIERLETPALVAPDRFARELARAERLFTARRWAQARAGFEPLARAATAAGDRELIALRLAEADYYLDRHRQARDALQPFLDGSSREAEARFFYLTATRALGDRATYVSLARRLVDDFPDSSWAEETLNNLASHYIIEDEDATADRVFRELAQRFPKSRYADRAAWRIGWWAYKQDRWEDAARTFDAAAAAFPRADLRPAWLYWSGRARDRAGDGATANERYRLAVTDYGSSYYGRLASKHLTDRRAPPVEPPARTRAADSPASSLPPTAPLIRQLIAAGLHADALKEVQYAQLAWGDSPPLLATVAWLRHTIGLTQQSMERFLNIRGAITQMKRAYPQYLTAGGEGLPREVLRVMFPLDHWTLIQKYAAERNLDPYLMASLIAQESTFTADIRSAANAYGLMQLLPATGRLYARRVGLRYSQALLTRPEANVRMGMAFFQDLMERFGEPHLALAAYNAGPHRVAEWLPERRGMAQDEFIDDIPFPETQNYVKRILGQAEDYRRLYGGGIATAP
jgi:soluble lytic murein transglycosylase